MGADLSVFLFRCCFYFVFFLWFRVLCLGFADAVLILA